MLNNPPASPLYKDADILPLMLTLPVNCEPGVDASTLNPKFGETDAVTLPLEIF